MAYINQEMKKKLAPEIQRVLADHGLKGSLKIIDHRKLHLTIKSGVIDFIGEDDLMLDYIQVNTHWIDQHYEGESREALNRLKNAMNIGNWDNSDAQTDYFDVGWYISINIGTYKRPYQLTS